MCEVAEGGRTDFVWSRPWVEMGAYFRPKKISPGSVANSIAGLPQQVPSAGPERVWLGWGGMVGSLA